jgi:hypothetical protein
LSNFGPALSLDVIHNLKGEPFGLSLWDDVPRLNMIRKSAHRLSEESCSAKEIELDELAPSEEVVFDIGRRL